MIRSDLLEVQAFFSQSIQYRRYEGGILTHSVVWWQQQLLFISILQDKVLFEVELQCAFKTLFCCRSYLTENGQLAASFVILHFYPESG